MNNTLKHHGVKGMKWGVRKADKLASLSAKQIRSNLELRDARNSYYTRPFKDKREMKRAAEDLLNKSNSNMIGNKKLNDMFAKLEKKYKSVKTSFEADAKTGKRYIRAKLEDKNGIMYTSSRFAIEYTRL